MTTLPPRGCEADLRGGLLTPGLGTLAGIGSASGAGLYASITPEGFQFLGLAVSATMGAIATLGAAWFGYLATRNRTQVPPATLTDPDDVRRLEALLEALKERGDQDDDTTPGPSGGPA